MTTGKISDEMKIASALKHRTIYLCDDVNRDSCFELNYYLDRIMRIDKENKVDKFEPITIHINSFGGSVYDGLGCISRIESMIEMGYEIVSIVDSYAMSMGSFISQVCSTRKAYRYATFLYHQVSSGTCGTTASMENDVKETRRLWEVVKNITLNHTKFTSRKLNKIHQENKDCYYTAKEMLELGVIDEII